MALINRMSRLFTADVHAVLDRIEEPDVLLKHSIREMDEELARSEQRVRQLEHEREALAERQRKMQAALAELVSQLDVCFSNGNDELARKVVKRKLETEKLGQHVAERSASIAKELAERHALVDEQRERLDVLRQKAELLAAAPSGGGDEWGRAGFTVSEDEVEVALLRERQARKPS
jgi:phage shock protein A